MPLHKFASAWRLLLCPLVVLCCLGCTPAKQEDRVIAIDILLQPDATMLNKAAEWNTRMREQSPQGFELDDAHAPHVTLLQRYISTSDLDAVLAAVKRVQTGFDLSQVRMEASGIYHIPAGDIGLAGIVVVPSPELRALQAAMIEAVQPYAKTSGGQTAFVPDASGTPFDTQLFAYVETFVPAQTGANYNPHVTVGIAPLEWLVDVEAQAFEPFTFGAGGIAVYQLGNFGTASKLLVNE